MEIDNSLVLDHSGSAGRLDDLSDTDLIAVDKPARKRALDDKIKARGEPMNPAINHTKTQNS